MIDKVQSAIALNEIVDERERQEKLREEGRFTHTPAEGSHYENLAMITEEIGEVAREVLTQPGDPAAFDTIGSPHSLRKELIQVAAIALAWCEKVPVDPMKQ